ncbi:MAG: nucleotidyltransferase domain-containing protein [Campylobacterota bacterium]|nr:nucleotidyltransferase domain-containing protein [Campylobacterota bacterium]
MRLSTKEISIIQNRVKTIFGDSLIYLFGSRVDDNKQGGDIDLYIIPKVSDNLFKKKIKIKTVLEDILFKPVDIVVAINADRLIEKEAIMGVKL